MNQEQKQEHLASLPDCEEMGLLESAGVLGYTVRVQLENTSFTQFLKITRRCSLEIRVFLKDDAPAAAGSMGVVFPISFC